LNIFYECAGENNINSFSSSLEELFVYEDGNIIQKHIEDSKPNKFFFFFMIDIPS